MAHHRNRRFCRYPQLCEVGCAGPSGNAVFLPALAQVDAVILGVLVHIGRLNEISASVVGKGRLGAVLDLLVSLAIMIAVVGVVEPKFFGKGNIMDVLRNTSYSFIIAAPLTLNMMSGGMDLTIGAVTSLGGVVCASLMLAGVPEPICIVAAILAGVLCGLMKAAHRGAADDGGRHDGHFRTAADGGLSRVKAGAVNDTHKGGGGGKQDVDDVPASWFCPCTSTRCAAGPGPAADIDRSRSQIFRKRGYEK